MENKQTTQKVSSKADEPKKKGRSPMYTIQSFNATVARVKQSEMLEKEDMNKLIEIKNKLVTKYLGLDMFMDK